MRILGTATTIVLLTALAGCNTSDPGGGNDKSTKFTLTGPTMATTIKQGDTETVRITLDRGKDFNQTIQLTVEDQPKGVSAEFGSSTVKASEKGEVTLRISVDKQAALGEHNLRVVGTPERGNATSVQVAVKVREP